jgi:putative peptide zinc metalloprotease protein
VERAYRAGGWLVFTRPAIAVVAALGVVGIAVFGFLVAERYGTPFVVADRLVVGGLVFLAGRLAIVVVHEGAHALALASVGRRVRRAGLKLLLVFPFAFVDTSEAWFEARRRRMLVSAAGPVSDLALAGLAAIGCLLLEGTVRDVLFQVAFAAYLGALLNLNPLLERDGYHVLVDVLREPGLRKRARADLARRLAGEARGEASPVLVRYAVAGLVWTVLTAALVVALSLRYRPALESVLPDTVVLVLLGSLWAACLVPAAAVVGPPLARRLRSSRAQASAA